MPSIIRHFPKSIKKLARSNPAAIRYVVDGLLAVGAVNIASSNYSLFAVRLGADDLQLSLVQFLPHFFTLLVLIPGGLLMDRLHNKKRIVIAMMLIVIFGFLLCAISPFADACSIQFFLGALALTGSAVALYNIAWQSFFPCVVGASIRNQVLTLRTRVTLIVSMVAPLLVGVALTRIGSIGGKIIAHQVFFVCALLLFVLAIFNFRKFRVKRQCAPQAAMLKGISLSEFANAGKSVLRNRQFLLFTATALFFHMTWHFDWTLYFIGQVHYLQMNELQLGLAGVGAALIQLVTLKFWSRKNDRYGVVLPFTFGILGLSLCPVIMVISVSIPLSIGPHLFVILHTLSHIPFCVVTLNLFQCILLVVDNEYRSFYMSVFASLLCLSNAVMPVIGIVLYRSLGGDLDGFRYALLIIFALRIIAALFWFLWWKMRNEKLAISNEK